MACICWVRLPTGDDLLLASLGSTHVGCTCFWIMAKNAFKGHGPSLRSRIKPKYHHPRTHALSLSLSLSLRKFGSSLVRHLFNFYVRKDCPVLTKHCREWEKQLPHHLFFFFFGKSDLLATDSGSSIWKNEKKEEATMSR